MKADTDALIEQAREILARAYQAKGWPSSAAQILRGESTGEPDSAPMIAVLEALQARAPETRKTSRSSVNEIRRAMIEGVHE